MDAKPYNNTFCDITWSKCTLRRWLNGQFMEMAFNALEQALIETSYLGNNADPETKDRVFLLSIGEAKIFFSNDNDRKAKSTDYAIKKDADTDDDSACWWLRSRGSYGNDAAIVCTDGSLYYNGFLVNISCSVRPAFRIAL